MQSNIRICGVISSKNYEIPEKTEDIPDIYEIRIDLIGKNWQSIISKIHKPWIATLRNSREGGKWKGHIKDKLKILNQAVELGASMVDIELEDIISIKSEYETNVKVKRILSYHNFNHTPNIEDLKSIVNQQIELGADICKIVTFARTIQDNLTLLALPAIFPERSLISFAMGEKGIVSRLMCPLAGSYMTYAFIDNQRKSAPGQLSVSILKQFYRTLRY